MKVENGNNKQKEVEEKDFASIKRTKAFKQIHESIITQLETNGTVIVDRNNKDNTYGKHFLDLADDYMTLWVTKQLLAQDIRNRGVTLFYNNGGGQAVFNKNDSVEQLLKVNAQMLRILSDLGVKPSLIVGVGDDL
jgi:hypothetical protein